MVSGQQILQSALCVTLLFGKDARMAAEKPSVRTAVKQRSCWWAEGSGCRDRGPLQSGMSVHRSWGQVRTSGCCCTACWSL